MEDKFIQIESEINEIKRKEKNQKLKYDKILKILKSSKNYSDFENKSKRICKGFEDYGIFKSVYRNEAKKYKPKYLLENKPFDISKELKDSLIQMFASGGMESPYFDFKIFDIIKDQYPYKIDSINDFLKKSPELADLIETTYKVAENIMNEYCEETFKLKEETVKLREEKIFIYEFMNSRFHQIKKLGLKDNNILFELDKDLVKQNQNMYPILFNYFEFIRKEILNKYEVTNRYTTNEEVYKYISNFTIDKKWTAVKTYYTQTFLYLINKKK